MVNKSDNKITAEILNRLKAYSSKIDIGYTGFVHEIADGIAKVKGLKEISYSELVEFSNGVLGVAINLEEDLVGIIVLGDYLDIKEGDRVKVTGRLLSIGVGNNLIGRVINPLGDAIDGKGEITNKKYYPIEKIAPSVTKRQPVNTPLQTGLKCIDSMIPIGRGQRELIIGDRGTGKTAIAIDTIINQKDQNVICIYVSIGQKTSRLAQIIDVLEKKWCP